MCRRENDERFAPLWLDVEPDLARQRNGSGTKTASDGPQLGLNVLHGPVRLLIQYAAVADSVTGYPSLSLRAPKLRCFDGIPRCRDAPCRPVGKNEMGCAPGTRLAGESPGTSALIEE